MGWWVHQPMALIGWRTCFPKTSTPSAPHAGLRYSHSAAAPAHECHKSRVTTRGGTAWDAPGELARALRAQKQTVMRLEVWNWSLSAPSIPPPSSPHHPSLPTSSPALLSTMGHWEARHSRQALSSCCASYRLAARRVGMAVCRVMDALRCSSSVRFSSTTSYFWAAPRRSGQVSCPHGRESKRQLSAVILLVFGEQLPSDSL